MIRKMNLAGRLQDGSLIPIIQGDIVDINVSERVIAESLQMAIETRSAAVIKTERCIYIINSTLYYDLRVRIYEADDSELGSMEAYLTR